MKQETFDKILERRVSFTKEVLSTKAGEYASDVDRLHNFKVAAKLGSKQITPEQALWGMLRKHLVSVVDMIDDTEKGIVASGPRIDEKIGDTINYFCLLEALFMERIIEQDDNLT